MVTRLGQRRGATTRQRAKSSHELAEGKRFGEIVVGAGVEAANAVVDGVARREHQHRGADSAFAQRSTEIEAAAAGEHDVENDDVIRGEHGAQLAALQRRLSNDLETVFA